MTRVLLKIPILWQIVYPGVEDREREREKNKMQLESTNKTHCAISLDIKKMERYGLELHQG